MFWHQSIISCISKEWLTRTLSEETVSQGSCWCPATQSPLNSTSLAGDDAEVHPQTVRNDVLSIIVFMVQKQGLLSAPNQASPKEVRRFEDCYTAEARCAFVTLGYKAANVSFGVSEKHVCHWPFVRALLPGAINSSDKQFSKFWQSLNNQ